MKFKKTAAAAEWIKWDVRRTANNICYAPGKELWPPTEGGSHSDVDINVWEGWGIEPAKKATDKDVKPFLDLLTWLFTGAEPESMQWFIDWCAYPIQHPGTKQMSAAVIHGIVHGTGKSLVGVTLGRIYGKNYAEIGQTDLQATFNEWAEMKQFVMGDDVTGPDKRKDADYIKKLITQETVRINVKYVPTYVVKDCINYYFTSNSPNAFFLEDTDRRFFIHEVTVGAHPDPDFYDKYAEWMNGPGPKFLARWLMDRDLSNYNPNKPAYVSPR